MSKTMETEHKPNILVNAVPEEEIGLPLVNDLIQQEQTQRNIAQQAEGSFVDVGWVVDALNTQAQTKTEGRSIMAAHGTTEEIKEYERELVNGPSYKFNAKNREKKRRTKLREKFERKNPGLLENRELLFGPAVELCIKFGNQMEEQSAQEDEPMYSKTADRFKNCLVNTPDIDLNDVVGNAHNGVTIVNGVEKKSGFSSLCDIFEQLQSKKNGELPAEEATELIERYQELKGGLSAGVASSEGLLLETTQYSYQYINKADQEKNKYITPLDPKTSYLLLYHCVVVALRNHIDTLADPEAVNMEAFGKLCGLAQLAEVAATHVCKDMAYKNERQIKRMSLENGVKEQDIAKKKDLEDKAEKARIEVEKARIERQTEANKAKIKEAVASGHQNVAWLSAEQYQDALEKQLSLHMGKSLEAFSPIMYGKLEALNRNLQKIALAVSNSKKLHLGMPQMEETLRLIAFETMETDGLLFSETDITADVIKQWMPAEKTEMYMKRQNKFIEFFENASQDKEKQKGYGKLSPQVLEALWKKAEVQELIINGGKNIEEELEKLANIYAKQAAFAINRMEAGVRYGRIRPCLYDQAIEEIKEKLGAACLFRSNADISTLIGKCLNAWSTDMKDTHTMAINLDKAIVAEGLNGTAKNLVDQYLIVNGFSEKFKNHTGGDRYAVCTQHVRSWKDFYEKNVKYLNEQLSDAVLTKTQFNALYEWSDQNIYKSNYEKGLTDRIETVKKEASETDAENAMTHESFRNLHKVEKLKVYKQQRKKAIKEMRADANAQERNKNELRKSVCQADIFEGRLAGYEDALLETIDTFLREKSLTETFGWMESVDNLASLDNLTGEERARLVSYLCGNLAMAIQHWGDIDTADARQIKTLLLPQMIRGQLQTKDEFEKAFAERKLGVESRAKAKQMKWFEGVVVSEGETKKVATIEKDKKTQEIDRITKIGYKKITYPLAETNQMKEDLPVAEYRARRMLYARQVWEELRANNEESDVLALLPGLLESFQKERAKKEGETFSRNIDATDFRDQLRKQVFGNSTVEGLVDTVNDPNKSYTDKKAYFDAVIKTNEKYRREKSPNYIPDLETKYRVWRAFTKVNQKLADENGGKEIVKGRKGFLLEFMMCGLEQQIFEKKEGIADAERDAARRAFLNEDDKKYDEALYGQIGKCIDSTIKYNKAFSEKLGKVLPLGKVNINRTKMQLSCRAKAEDMLLNMKWQDPKTMSEREKQENTKRFGVASWDDYMDKAQEMMDLTITNELYKAGKEQALGILNPSEAKLQQIEEMGKVSELHRRRRSAISNYNGGLLQPLLEKIEASEEGWNHMMLSDDASFDVYLKEVDKKASEGLKAINKAQSAVLAKQFLQEFGSQILAGEQPKDNKTWEEKYSHYEKSVLEKEIGDSWFGGSESIKDRLENAYRGVPGTESMGEIIDHYTAPRELTGEERRAFARVNKHILDTDELFFHVFSKDAMLAMYQKQVKIAAIITQVYKEKAALLTTLPPEARAEVNRRVGEAQLGYGAAETKMEDVHTIVEDIVIQVKELADTGVFEVKRAERIEKGNTELNVAARKQRALTADSENLKMLNELRRQTWKVGSPILAAGTRNAAVDTGEVRDIQEYMRKFCNEATPAVVRDILLEHLLVHKEEVVQYAAKGDAYAHDKMQKMQERVQSLQKWLDEVYTETANMKQLATPAKQKAFMHYYYLKAGQKSILNKADMDKRVQEFEADFGKVEKAKEIYKGLSHPEVQAEYKDYVSCFSMAAYTMDHEKFNEFFDRRADYFESLDAAYKVFDDAMLNAKVEKEDRDWYRKVLRQYFHEEILQRMPLNITPMARYDNKQGKDAFKDRVQECLDSTSLRKHMFGNVSERKWEETQNGPVVASRLTFEEKLSAFVANQNFLQKNVTERSVEPCIQEYEELDEEQRKVFALVVMLPGQFLVNDSLPGTKIMAGQMQLDRPVTQHIQQQLAAYVGHKDFNPVPDYNVVIEKLTTENNGLNLSGFQSALHFTKHCIREYEAGIPKDTKRLSDGYSSIEAAAYLSAKALEVKETLPAYVSSKAEFKALLLQHFPEDSQSVDGILDAFVRDTVIETNGKQWELDDSMYDLLIRVLQDRTLLDYTTGTTTEDTANGAMHQFVNQEQREELVKKYLEDDLTFNKNVNNAASYTQAMTSLFSYQLRDDINFTGRDLTKDDFAAGALKRKTVIDWKLLSRAIDFVNEVDKEKRRLAAVRSATRHVGNVGCEASKKLFADINITRKTDKQKEIPGLDSENFQDDRFMEILSLEAHNNSDEKINPSRLLIAYRGLTTGEQQLFLRALEHRDLLDVSSQGKITSTLGLADRKYVNEDARNKLADEYLANSLLTGKRLENRPDEYSNAMLSLLSTQVDDSLDFRTIEGSLEDKTVAERYLILNRTTAIDWKLFQRALQFVKRTTNEKRIMQQDASLVHYVGGGKNGEFKNETGSLRVNLHRSGNRFTRFCGRKAVERIKAQIDVPLQSLAFSLLSTETTNHIREELLSTAPVSTGQLAFGLLSTETANAINSTGFNRAPEEAATVEARNVVEELAMGSKELMDSVVDQIESALGQVEKTEGDVALAKDIGEKILKIYTGMNIPDAAFEKKEEEEGDVAEEEKSLGDKVSEYLEKYGEDVIPADKMDSVLQFSKQAFDIVGMAQEATTCFTDAVSFFTTLGSKFGKLSDMQAALKEAEHYDTAQKEKLETKKVGLSEQQAKRLDEGALRHTLSQKLAGSQVDDVLKEEIITDIVNATVTVLEKTGTVGDIADMVKEGLDFAFFIKQYYQDSENVKAYIEQDPSIQKDLKKTIERHRNRELVIDKSKKGNQSNGGGAAFLVVDKNLETDSPSDVVQSIYGFEAFDELSDFVGHNIVHSLLFSASEQNPLRNTRICARAALTALGMKHLIGRRDMDTAQEVFRVLTGQKYK